MVGHELTECRSIAILGPLQELCFGVVDQIVLAVPPQPAKRKPMFVSVYASVGCPNLAVSWIDTVPAGLGTDVTGQRRFAPVMSPPSAVAAVT